MSTKASVGSGSADGSNSRGYATPPRLKKVRRRANGSPVIPRDTSAPTKTVWMIRHGQSMGQAAAELGMDRKSDPRLLDCKLTRRGVDQAVSVPQLLGSDAVRSIELVVSSPLTRALHTAVLAFRHECILVHYDLREIGSKVPENQPRRMELVLQDLRDDIVGDGTVSPHRVVDTESLKPDDWPRDCSPPVIKRERIRRFLRWLYDERPETTIAVVCHYNVIRSCLNEPSVRPANADPILCRLHSNGELDVVQLHP